MQLRYFLHWSSRRRNSKPLARESRVLTFAIGQQRAKAWAHLKVPPVTEPSSHRTATHVVLRRTAAEIAGEHCLGQQSTRGKWPLAHSQTRTAVSCGSHTVCDST